MNRIGGSARVREDLSHALEVGRKVTAKVQWLSKSAPKSRARWIHCTPLLGVNDAIGVWMVILVDDEDEVEDEPEQKPNVPPRSSSRLAPGIPTEAIPWSASEKKASGMGVSTSIWSEGQDIRSRPEDHTKSRPRKPLFRQPSDMGESMQPPLITRPGPKIAGKAYSYTSNSDGQLAADDTSSTSGDLKRPESSSSSSRMTVQSSLQPKVRIGGRQSMDSDSARKPPINLPYRPSVDEGEEGRIPVRRTYKSLSPYGVLFED